MYTPKVPWSFSFLSVGKTTAWFRCFQISFEIFGFSRKKCAVASTQRGTCHLLAIFCIHLIQVFAVRVYTRTFCRPCPVWLTYHRLTVMRSFEALFVRHWRMEVSLVPGVECCGCSSNRISRLISSLEVWMTAHIDVRPRHRLSHASSHSHHNCTYKNMDVVESTLLLLALWKICHALWCPKPVYSAPWPIKLTQCSSCPVSL